MSKGKEEKSKVTQSQIAMIDFSEKAIVEFGDYTNNKRHMPGLYDGCKPSYRRVIYTTMEFPDKMVKVMTLSGKCSGQYSPHKSESLNDVISNLVRIGVLDGQGGHGSKAILKEHCKEAAAPRYIEAKLNKNWRDMMDPLMKYVDWSMSELNYREPDFLPSPVQISLIH
jgi:DNA gyrase/topoisomerase IV subunit A